MFGTTPEGGKAKLCIGIEKGFFEKTLLWMVELANERIVQTGLPFLDEGYFKTAVVPLCRYRWGSEPKYTSCHVHANSAGPVRLGPISHG